MWTHFLVDTFIHSPPRVSFKKISTNILYKILNSLETHCTVQTPPVFTDHKVTLVSLKTHIVNKIQAVSYKTLTVVSELLGSLISGRLVITTLGTSGKLIGMVNFFSDLNISS